MIPMINFSIIMLMYGVAQFQVKSNFWNSWLVLGRWTNDWIQLKLSNFLFSPNWCVLCKNSDDIDHLFLHYPIAYLLWSTLHNNMGIWWVIEDLVNPYFWNPFSLIGGSNKVVKEMVLYMGWSNHLGIFEEE